MKTGLSFPRRMRRLLLLGLATAGGCVTTSRLRQLDDGRYRLVGTSVPALRAEVPARQWLYLRQRGDTLYVGSDTAAVQAARAHVLRRGQSATLLTRQFDLDIFTIPFKIYPSREGLPLQLNTNFNAALYLGRRYDFYRLTARHASPLRPSPGIQSTGFGYGGFVGLGSSIITADLTRGHAVTDYEGFVLHTGLAGIYDARSFNLGFAVGLDHLLGDDADYWIHQHKPWFGVLFGLDLN